jgi:hypothetical protein
MKIELKAEGCRITKIELDGHKSKWVTGIRIEAEVNEIPRVHVDYIATDIIANIDPPVHFSTSES